MKNVWGQSVESRVPDAAREKVFLAFDLYIDEICGSLQESRDLTEEQVLDVVFRCADKLAEKGRLPPFPQEDDAGAMGRWLLAADRVGFDKLVDRLAGVLSG